MRSDNPFHDGEIAIQTRAGEQLMAERNGRAINTQIMPGALKFVAQQPLVVFGSVDESQNVWASIVVGKPGFATAPDPHTVSFDFSSAGSFGGDPLWRNIGHDPRVGTLFIELASRRRLRINGRVTREASGNLRLAVREAYPNCPKYIQRRQLRTNAAFDDAADDANPTSGTCLADGHRQWIERCDTFFVASANPGGHIDASHRGGDPGFVRVLGDHTLRIPDYAGNSMYNTLGNFKSNPRAGLAFIDFESGRILQMTGTPTILWDQAEQREQPTGGTGRYWDFAVTRWIEGSLNFWSGADFLDRWDGNPAGTLE